jgi:hypothetical protein
VNLWRRFLALFQCEHVGYPKCVKCGAPADTYSVEEYDELLAENKRLRERLALALRK